jgi:hypothetical protein
MAESTTLWTRESTTCVNRQRKVRWHWTEQMITFPLSDSAFRKRSKKARPPQTLWFCCNRRTEVCQESAQPLPMFRYKTASCLTFSAFITYCVFLSYILHFVLSFPFLHHHHWLDSPWWVLAFFRSFAHSSLSRATFFQFYPSYTPHLFLFFLFLLNWFIYSVLFAFCFLHAFPLFLRLLN